MVQITEYKGIQNIYFRKILTEIIDLGNLDRETKKILDYGCGDKQLEKMLNKKIMNYDINPKLTEIKTIENIDFDIIIFNHVLMYMNKNNISELFDQIKIINPNCEFIIGIGKQNFLSKLAKNITLNFDAHKGTVSSYQDQIDVISEKMIIKEIRKNIFYMTDIFYLEFNQKV